MKRRCARYINPLLGDEHGLISFDEVRLTVLMFLYRPRSPAGLSAVRLTFPIPLVRENLVRPVCSRCLSVPSQPSEVLLGNFLPLFSFHCDCRCLVYPTSGFPRHTHQYLCPACRVCGRAVLLPAEPVEHPGWPVRRSLRSRRCGRERHHRRRRAAKAGQGALDLSVGVQSFARWCFSRGRHTVEGG